MSHRGTPLSLAAMQLPTSLLVVALFATGDSLLRYIALGILVGIVNSLAVWAALGPDRDAPRQFKMAAIALVMYCGLLFGGSLFDVDAANANASQLGVEVAGLFVISQIPLWFIRIFGGVRVQRIQSLSGAGPQPLSLRQLSWGLIAAPLIPAVALGGSAFCTSDLPHSFDFLFSVSVIAASITINATLAIWGVNKGRRILPWALFVCMVWPFAIGVVEHQYLRVTNVSSPTLLELSVFNSAHLATLFCVLYVLRYNGFCISPTTA